MLYWAIWPATGIAFLCVFSLFVLPSVVKNTRAAFKTEGHMRKYAWLAAFSLSSALEVGLLCFIIAAFVDRAQNGFPLGAGWAGAHAVWPVYVFAGVAAALCAAGAVYIELGKKRDISRGKSSEPSPSPRREVQSVSIRKGQKRELPEPVPQSAQETQKPAVGERDKCRAAIHITAAILLTVCVLSAASILTVIFNYILLKLFSVSASKKILLLMAGRLAVHGGDCAKKNQAAETSTAHNLRHSVRNFLGRVFSLFVRPERGYRKYPRLGGFRHGSGCADVGFRMAGLCSGRKEAVRTVLYKAEK